VDGLEAKLKEKNAEGEASKNGDLDKEEAEEEEDWDAAEPAAKRLATGPSRTSDEEGLRISTDVKPSYR
jgi:hypothetical protein